MANTCIDMAFDGIVWPFSSFNEVICTILERKESEFNAQIKYLFGYLNRRGAHSIVIERGYTDGDYLADYANYYSRCHEDYPRKTTRLHFFSCELTDADFESILLDGNPEKFESLSSKYLGFSVIKPLPETIVGRTCLKAYDEVLNADGCLRYFPISREYTVSCYGLPLTVRSVAFQEQDAEVAACSTTAIWYVLHASPKRLTESEIPSPYDITSKAMSVAFNAGNVKNGSPHRRFPTPGLDLRQIAEYLRWSRYDSFVVGIVPEADCGSQSIPGGTARLTNDLVLAYLSSKTPLLAVGTLSTRQKKTAELIPHGLHAVTILGYSLDPDEKGHRRHKKQQVNWRFQRVANLYIHDDGVGPFARYNWAQYPAEKPLLPGNEIEPRWFLENRLENDEACERHFDPAYVIVPIRDKVRLSHSAIMEYVELVCGVIYSSPSHGMVTEDFARLKVGEWSIELTEVNDLKREILTKPTLAGERVSWSKAPLPKYLWRVVYSISSASKNEYKPDWEILFDATALTQAVGLIGFLTHDNGDPLNTQMMGLFAACLNNQRLPDAITRHAVHVYWKEALCCLAPED